MKKTLYRLAIFATLLAAVDTASAHFIWVAVENDSSGKPTVQVWFSELAEPDDEKLIDKIMHTKAWLHEAGKPPAAVALKKVVADGGGSLAGAVSAKPPYSTTAAYKYGVIERNGKVFLLNYYAKYLESDSASLTSLGRAESLALDIVPRLVSDKYELQVLWKGKPAGGCEVTIIAPDAKEEKLTTDEAGNVRLTAKAAGLYSIRAKLAEDAAGEEAGKEYKQVMHYSTLALRVAPANEKDAKPAAK